MRVLISGGGIAGSTLAYWLAHCGFTPTIVEKAPALRTGGYVIDFWGAGLEVARRMHLLPELLRSGYHIREVKVVNERGKRISGFPAAAFFRASRSDFISLPRGDLAATIFGALAGKVETIFGDTIEQIEQTADAAQVWFARSGPRRFDLVVGADGLHSRVRELVFGPESRFERYLGIKVAACEVDGYRPRDELAYVMSSEVGQQVARFAMKNDRTLFLFTIADPDPAGPPDIDGQKALLRRRFANSGSECRRILDSLDASHDWYFDRVSQIEMNDHAGAWANGRITLIGDAAFCISLLGGQGSALAMAAAYILAGELRKAGGDHEEAFARYQQLFGPFAAMKQRVARRFAALFVPSSAFSLFLRNQVFRLLSIDWIADLTAGREFIDRIALPQY